MVEGRQYRARHQSNAARALRGRGKKYDGARAVAPVMMEIMLDDADVLEPKPVGFLGERECILKYAAPDFSCGRTSGKNWTPNSMLHSR